MQTPNIQPILASVDFSQESKEALLFASDLSQQEGRPLVVLHVMHDDGDYDGPYRRTSEKAVMLPMQEIAEQVMDDFINGVRDEQPDNAVLGRALTMVIDGLPRTRIPEVAKKINAGRVVVGDTRRGRLSRLLDPSVTDSLAKNCPVPVTVYRSRRETDLAEEAAL